MRTLLTLLAAIVIPFSSSSAQSAGADNVDFPLPANWQRKGSAGFLTFVRAAEPESGLKTVLRLKPLPKAGTLAETFLVLWPQLIRGLYPNEPLQNKMVPLVIQNSKGVRIAFDGDGLMKNPFSVMLYLVDMGDEVLPFLGIFASEPMNATLSAATSRDPSAPAAELAHAVDGISLKVGKSSSGPLFDPAKLVGAYSHVGVGSMATYRSRSGANLGDASTGLSQDIEFKPNGDYAEQSVAVVNGHAQGVETDAGTWKLEGYHVTVHFRNSKLPDKKWLLMGLGSDRTGKNFVAYLIDPRFTDKWFIEMFRQGANMNTYFYTRK